MLFREHIPDRVLEHETPRKFIEVLDELYKFKLDKMFNALRHTNPILLTDRKWIVKKLSDYGVHFIPMEFPIAIMQQFLLNADVILGTRGSIKGLELFLSVMTLGKVTINDSAFYSESDSLILNSKVQGIITGDSKKGYKIIGEDLGINPPMSIAITIESFYFNDASIKTLIMDVIRRTYGEFIGFSPNRTATFSLATNDKPYFHPMLNKYFV